MAWRSTADVDEYLDRAGAFLRARPAAHTLALTVLETLRVRGPGAFGAEPPLLGWWQAGDAVGGAFVHTPPHPLLLMCESAGGEPVAMAGRSREVAGMTRIAPVYTPPAQRRRGYATAVTAAVSRAGLDAGAREVLLFTDLADATTNALYQRLG